VVFGLTVIVWVFAPFDQRYVPPAVEGEAVSVTDCPAQTLVLFTVTVGGGGVVMQVVNVPGVSYDALVKRRIRYVVFGVKPVITVGFGALVLKSQFPAVPLRLNPVAKVPHAV
jgi:hypothetical protein